MALKKEKLNLTVQPQAQEAEQAVIGSMLLSKEAVSKAFQWLGANNFYKDAHMRIFSCMIDLFNKGEPIDTVSVVDRIKKKKELESVGGAYYITGLAESCPTTANVEHYAKIVLEKHLLRKLIEVSNDVSQEAYDDSQDVDDILDAAESAIFAISEKRLRGGFQHIDPILQDTFEKIDALQSKSGAVTGVGSGFMDLDEMTSGWHAGEFIIIAGRPGMGKTALALNLARNAAVNDKVGVGIFSLEMSNYQLAMRFLCSEGRIDSHLVRTGRLPKNEWKKLSLAVGKLADAPIYLDDTPGLTVLEIRAKARRLKAEHNVGLIIVDYLQLMSGPKGAESRQQEISVISRSLKGLAKELDLPVIALSQLSRAVENRTDHRPQLSDLRESGAIEQDADLVAFLYRPWIYNHEAEKGEAEIIISKQRNGPTGKIQVVFNERFARFDDRSFAEMRNEP
ncbi:MAG: replicative DNA helicase [Candidatus Neomarinimicrobiota bacterium]